MYKYFVNLLFVAFLIVPSYTHALTSTLEETSPEESVEKEPCEYKSTKDGKAFWCCLEDKCYCKASTQDAAYECLENVGKYRCKDGDYGIPRTIFNMNCEIPNSKECFEKPVFCHSGVAGTKSVEVVDVVPQY